MKKGEIKMILNVVSFNIKCDDTIAELQKEQLWENRKDNLVKEILDLNADLIGMQEAMPHQYDYFKENLKEYGSIYCSRDKNASTSWNSRWPRICSYVVLKDKSTGKQFAFFNTHLDHKSDEARTNGVKLIVSKIKELNLPVILMGDFNSTKQNMAYGVAKSYLTDCNEKNDGSITFHLWGHPEILQNGITNIGEYAFSRCKKLTSITLPNSLRKIGHNAFSYTGISKITIPKDVERIEGYTFGWCTQLKSIIIQDKESH